MIRRLVLLFTALLCAASLHGAIADDSRTLVLVRGANGGDIKLTTTEVRRLFLGLPITKNGHTLSAAINHTDPLLYQVFLQKVVFMSSHVYERHLLTNVVRLGGQRPQSYTDPRELLNTLRERSDTVTFMWNDEINPDPAIVIIKDLWHGTIQ